MRFVRTCLLAALCAATLCAPVCIAAPICAEDDVTMTLRQTSGIPAQGSSGPRGDYTLALTATDKRAPHEFGEYVEINYRINDAAGVRRHVRSEDSVSAGAAAKQAEVSHIRMEDGDVLRAYATYTLAKRECDTVLYTFSTPEGKESTARGTIDLMRKRRVQEQAHLGRHDEL